MTFWTNFFSQTSVDNDFLQNYKRENSYVYQILKKKAVENSKLTLFFR